MAARRSSTACLFCRCHATLTIRRRTQHSVKRNLQTAAIGHNDGEQTGTHDMAVVTGGSEAGSLKSITDAMKRWTTHIPMNEVRGGVEALEVMVRLRDKRQEVLRNLSKSQAVPEMHSERLPAKDKLRLPEAQAAPIPHATYRELLRQAGSVKQIRQVLRAQLLRVTHPKDLLRVAAVAMQNRQHAEQLAILQEPIMRALYRCRTTVTDAEVLRTCSTIVSRLRFAGLVPHYQLLTIGMKFAARARSIEGMKKFLKLVRERNITMTSNLFRSVIAKFSIGHRGLGEIRNGRWRRADLMQVLIGFDDCKHLPPDQQYHLGVFLDREDWQYLHGWVAVLARCKASDEVWAEWLLWKQDSACTHPRRLLSTDRYMDTRWRGEFWFVEQMTYTGDIKRAWRVLEDTAIDFDSLKSRIKTRLLDGAEHASIWTSELTTAMLDKYDAELSRIERAFGVTWQAGAEDGEGHHVLFRDQEEALDELGAREWKAEEDFGFPTDGDDEDMALSTQERRLHDAQEGAPVAGYRSVKTREMETGKLHDIHDARFVAF